VCPNGSNCSGGKCIVRIGITNAPPNCSGAVSDINAGLLIVQAISASSTVTVTKLGVVGNAPSGLSGFLVLYNSDGAGGGPGTIGAETGTNSIGNGVNEFPIGSGATLTAGTTYYIGGYYSAAAPICNDGAGSNVVASPTTYSWPAVVTAPYQPFGPTLSPPLSVGNFSYYVVGTE
jgi:hypothetical protein